MKVLQGARLIWGGERLRGRAKNNGIWGRLPFGGCRLCNADAPGHNFGLSIPHQVRNDKRGVRTGIGEDDLLTGAVYFGLVVGAKNTFYGREVLKWVVPQGRGAVFPGFGVV